MSGPSDGEVKDLNDSRNQALQALISSLAPSGSSEEKKLSEEQVSALSDRLSQILGSPGEGPEERRNERGELLNEEGLPIIDIAEPVGDASGPSQTSEAFVSEHDPVPLSALSEQDRLQLRARRDLLLDMLEEEEERLSEKGAERERRRKMEELSKMDAERKAAAREMQKKLGKALLKNLAAQREQEEEEKKKAQEAAAAEACIQNGESSCRKPKKSVSFANVPEVDEVKPKPKPSVAWGDVSVAKLKAGIPKARLKTEVLSKQPMKLEVVERVPGAERTSSPQQRDSDDESNPEEQDLESDEDEDEDEENTPPLDGDFEDSDESTRPDDDSEEDEFDFSQARTQREVALEYVRLRESIGAEAHQAITSHTHGGENEWDQPEVPLEATLSSKSSKSGMSRFKAARQANQAASSDASISLGASVLPQDKSSALQRAVRTGKLADGKLVGGEVGESASEDEGSEHMKRMMEMLKNGVVINDVSLQAADIPARTDDKIEKINEQEPSTMPLSSFTRLSNPRPAKASRFLSERAAQRPLSEPIPGPSPLAASASSPLSSTASERSASKRPSLPPSVDVRPSENGQPPTDTAFKKPPTVISVPSIPSSKRRPFAAPQVKPDSAVLSNMIVESPSFPPPSASAQSALRAPPLASEVRESTRRAGMTEESTQRTGRVSRFKAERL